MAKPYQVNVKQRPCAVVNSPYKRNAKLTQWALYSISVITLSIQLLFSLDLYFLFLFLPGIYSMHFLACVIFPVWFGPSEFLWIWKQKLPKFLKIFLDLNFIENPVAKKSKGNISLMLSGEIRVTAGYLPLFWTFHPHTETALRLMETEDPVSFFK
jgi:hypothetical protein